MKVIDLLNKIANGEERPRAIKYGLTIYRLKESNFKYYYVDEDNNLFEEAILLENLNEEVETIEEDKKIEKIEMPCFSLFDVADKVNEIIDKLNAGVDKK